MAANQARLKCKIKARLRVQGIIRRDSSLFSKEGRNPVLQQVTSADLRTALEQLYDLLDQSLEAQQQARQLMLRAARAFPEIKILRTAPGIGPLGACRFSADIQTPHRFSSKRKLWRYCRLSISFRSGRLANLFVIRSWMTPVADDSRM